VNPARHSIILAFVSLAVVGLVGCSTGDDEAATGNAAGEQKACAPNDSACNPTAGFDPMKTDTSETVSDGKKDGTESDVDCGGSGAAPRCVDGKTCKAGTDCESKVCTGGTCQAPKGDDTVMNGDETDVDCGGKIKDTARCAVGKGCKAHEDCESDGCGYNGKCVSARSCAGHFGGDTCGSGEVGEAGAQHESCCEAAPVSNAANAVMLDKYVITAGRMRQFAERTKGNLRSFTETLGGNPEWKPAWNDMMPTNMGEMNFLLGPQGHGASRAGCDLNEARGRTYWMTDAENDDLGDGHHAFTKDILDQKALNCVEFFMMQALCIWDGGRLAKQAEIATAWNGGENRTYPWGNAMDESKMVFKSNYAFPEVYDQGNWVYIAAPGRRPAGNGKHGHSDLAGLMIEITSDVGAGVLWSGNGSWEGHGVSPKGAPLIASTDITRAYWAAGGRCAHPQ
jgi:hypothetical protein